jgi:signal transduction histidine kinase
VGCDGFIQKPIDASQFSELVAGYLAGRRELPVALSSNHRLRAQSGRIVVHLEEKVAELSAANARLREMERLRREFYRNISHELATPMTPIVGYLRMLIDEELGSTAPAQSKALRAMDDCVQRLRNTLDSLVDVTALEMGKIKFFYRTYDFARLVRAALENTAALRDAHKQVVIASIPSEAMVAYGDSEKLVRAVGHVLDNASKFTTDGGAIGVAVRALPDGYELVVADEGPGIREGYEERVFEPFFQVDGSPTRAQGGVGLGLAIARGVARGLGGDISLTRGAVIEGHTFGGACVSFRVAQNAHQIAQS